MTTEVKEEKKEEQKSIWSSDERENCKTEYGCELLVENGSYQEVCTKQAPTDAFIVRYMHGEKLCFDLTRGTKSHLFDMYYDKFKDSLKTIEFGHGSIKPNLWGYKEPQKQKKKRKG